MSRSYDLLRPVKDAEEVARPCWDALEYTAVQKPIDGISQLINHIAGKDLIYAPQIFQRPAEVDFGSSAWVAQQVGSAFGNAVDLMAASYVCSKIPGLRKLGPTRLVGADMKAASALQKFMMTPGRAFAKGFLFEALCTPVHEDEADSPSAFWRARLRNGVNGGVALGSMSLTESLMDSGMSHCRTLGKLDTAALHLPGRLTRSALAGAMTAQTQALMSNQRLATADELKQSSLSYAAGFGTWIRFGGGQFIQPPVHKTGLNIKSEYNRLSDIIDNSGIAAEARPLFSAFQQRADRISLPEDERARTFHNLRKLFEGVGTDYVTAEQQHRLGLECLHHAAYPTSIDQGRNNTCNVSTVEGRLFATSPSDPIRLIGKVAANGGFTTPSGHRIEIDPLDIKPDSEARSLVLKDIGNGQRTFASQLFQLGAVNAHWQSQTTGFDGNPTAAGSIKYLIHSGFPNGPNEERIVQSTPVGEVVRKVSGEMDHSPSVSLSAMMEIERQISGKQLPDRIITARSGGRPGSSIVKCETLTSFQQTLQRIRDQHRFPVTLSMDIRSNQMWQDMFGDGQVFCNSLTSSPYHVVQIYDYSPETGMVSVDNTWGDKNDYSGKPGQRSMLTVEQVFGLMQDSAARTETLSLQGNKTVEEDAFSQVCAFPNLKVALIGDTNCADKAFANFLGKEKLEILDASKTKITDASAKVFTSLHNLRSVNLSDTGVGDQTAVALSAAKRLEVLDLRHTKVTDEGVKHIAKLSELKHLTLDGCQLGDASLDAIAKLTKLEQLQLVCSGFSADRLQKLVEKLPKLQLLTLDADSVSPESMKALPHGAISLFSSKDHSRITTVAGPQRTELKVQGGDKPLELIYLSKLKSSDALHIEYAGLTKEAADRLASHTRMKSLSLRQVRVPNDCWSKVLNSPSLEALSICRRTFGIVGEITGSLSLDTELTLPKQFFEAAASRPSLRHLQVTAYQFAGADAQKLGNHQGLRSVSVNSSATDGALLDALSTMPKLTSLEFVDTEVTGAPEQFSAPPQLETLSVRNTRLGDELVHGLIGSRSLTSLTMSRSALTDSGANELAKISGLKELSLSDSGISDNGTKEIASLRNLRKLDLSGTKVSDVTVARLRALPQLESLNLVSTATTAEAINKLSTVATLRNLTVSRSAVTREQEEHLRRSLPHCNVVVVEPFVSSYIEVRPGTVEAVKK